MGLVCAVGVCGGLISIYVDALGLVCAVGRCVVVGWFVGVDVLGLCGVGVCGWLVVFWWCELGICGWCVGCVDLCKSARRAAPCL